MTTAGGGTGTTAGTGETTSGSSTAVGSSSGGFVVGAVEAEDVTTVPPADAGNASSFALRGQFLPVKDWPNCIAEPLAMQENACCFAPDIRTATGIDEGMLELTIELTLDGMTAQGLGLLNFEPELGEYSSDWPEDAGTLFATSLYMLGKMPDPAYSGAQLAVDPKPPPPPDLIPSLSLLQALSTSEDWIVQLTPGLDPRAFGDRVVLEVDGQGRIICQMSEDGGVSTSLVVPATLLAKFAGQAGTVSVYRDEYTGLVDAGSLLIGFRSGIGIRTSPGAVAFLQ